MKIQGYLFLFVLPFVLLLASTAGAALPTAINSSASTITRNTATLNASINANNEDATVTFEYSTQPLEGQDNPEIQTIAATPPLVTGSSYTAVTADLTSLDPGTVYFFRPVAVNASGTTYGSTVFFSTVAVATATTQTATPVTTTGATLKGIVNPLSEETTVHFEYGGTSAYGFSLSADQSPVSGDVDTEVTTQVTGLSANITYHYRVVATNAYGTVYGDDTTFFTSAQAAPSVTTGAATFSFTVNSATLNGSVTANNSEATITFEYGTTTAYGTTVTANQSPVVGTAETQVSKNISGLTPDTTYHYRVVGTNSQGTSYGADQIFYNTTSPYAATEAASAVGNSTARLNGTVNPKTFDGGTSSWTTAVTFEYGLTTSYGHTVTAQESPMGGDINQNASAALTGLQPGTIYHYRIVADNTNGTTTGEDVIFMTYSLPDAETITAAPVESTSATLNATVNPYGEVTNITFEYGLTTSYGNTVTADGSPSTENADTSFSATISGLNQNTTYHFRVVASNGSGTTYGEDRTFVTGTPPPTATTKTATSISSTAAVLNGTVNANGLSTTVGFEYGSTPTFDRTTAATPSILSGSSATDVSLSLSNLLPGTTYYYRVKATNAGGTVYGTVSNFETIAPPAVTTEEASGVTTTSATLNGSVNANDLASTVTFEYGTTTSYGTSITADQSPVAGTADTAVSYALSGLTPAITYHYRVVASNAAGTTYGDDRTFTTSVGPPTAVTGNAFPLTLGAEVDGTVNAVNAATTVTFEYGTTVAYGSSVTASPSPINGSDDTQVRASLSGLSFNTTYHYRVVATNAHGTTNGADSTFKTSLNPTALTLGTSDIRATTATLHGEANGNGGTWSVRFDYGPTVAYGSTVTATPSTVSGSTTTSISAGATNLTPNTTYHYRATVYSGGMTYPGDDRTFTTLTGPAVTTDVATSVDATQATMNATITANSNSTSVMFEYGLDTGYGHSTQATPATVNGATPTAVSSQLFDLIPLTTYHYRAMAANSDGTVYGSDQTFTTGGIAPAATTTAASNVGSTYALFNGSVDANNDSTTVTFEYGLTTSYGASVTASQSPVTGTSPVAVQESISGLSVNKLYNYRIVAQNSTGTTYGENVTFFTTAVKPATVTLAATAVNSTGAVLNGTINANGNATAVFFEVGSDTSYGRSYAATPGTVTGSGTTAVSVILTDVLLPDTTYHFRVVGQSAAGTSYGADMTLYTRQRFPWQILLPGLVSPNKQEN
ncbi:beta strand repeat-containing protein [Desulfogranum japonicum]|uniref:beta strand repeat-containing protein n=1 Tax=Desulfogranum japonicum TaxID=231447 RepID=UPI000422E1E5|nr:hypothetical protein [Desulfogranum japonicum]